MRRWQNSVYIQEIVLSSYLPGKIYIEVATAPYIDHLQTVYVKNLGLMLAIAILALIFAELFSRQLVQPLSKLTQVTTNLPQKLIHQETITWPSSTIAEIQRLTENSQLMATILTEKFGELQQSKETLEQRVQERTQALQSSLEQLQEAQLKLIQSEKMSTLGELAAGVAHEINNPVGFIAGNLQYAQEYIKDMIKHLQLYQHHYPNPVPDIEDHAEEIELEYLIEDLPDLIASMKEGTDRIIKISTSMRTFSRSDTDKKVACNIHEGIDSTLLILQHRLKATPQRPGIKIIKNYADIPLIDCYPGQLNQVFMNLLANAIDALDDKPKHPKHRQHSESESEPNFQIAITTEIRAASQDIEITIEDTGMGIPAAIQAQVFEHLFTTKPVGKGTGLGLSISRNIIEAKHQGTLSCTSEVGRGTAFTINLPLS